MADRRLTAERQLHLPIVLPHQRMLPGAGLLEHRWPSRRPRRRRAEHGPEREIWFTQAHRPGEAARTDFTSTAELAVTIAGQLFLHLLCVTVLPYSNWQWATACLSESLAALRRGVQAALFQLGRVPRFHQTDH